MSLQHHEQCVKALQRIALLADTGSDAHKEEFTSYYADYDKPTGWRVAERMREIANDAIGNAPLAYSSTPYDRAVQEKLDLDLKIQRLRNFVTRNNMFEELPADERGRLSNQLACMCSYSSILTDRINSFDCGQEVPNVEDLTIYKRAMESMAAQFIHPKMTALELAEMQLKGVSHAG